MATKTRLTTVKQGTSHKLKVYRGGQQVEETFEVKEACDDKGGGRWVCITHGEAFANQLAKDAHISCGKHELAWHCFSHGTLEVP